MTGLRSRWCSLRREDGGWSLVELLVVMMLFAGLLGISYTVLISVQRQTVDNLSRGDVVAQAKIGLAQIDRQVRSGNVVIDPAAAGELPRSLRVYTQTDGVHRCVQWQVYDGTLRFRSWMPDWDTSGAYDPWRVVAHNVLGDADGAPVTFERLTDAGGSQAQSVRVRLWLRAEGSAASPAVVETVLFGRNTIYGYPGDRCAPVPPA